MRSLAEEVLAKVEQERGKPNTAPTSIELLNGPPAEIIEEFLRPSDLLVIGSRGIGGVRRLLLGSVSSALVQTAPCPVVVVRPEPAPGGRAPRGIARRGLRRRPGPRCSSRAETIGRPRPTTFGG